MDVTVLRGTQEKDTVYRRAALASLRHPLGVSEYLPYAKGRVTVFFMYIFSILVFLRGSSSHKLQALNDPRLNYDLLDFIQFFNVCLILCFLE